MKRYKIYDYSAGGRALESYNILNDLVYYFGYYMCNKDRKGNVNWNGVGDDISTSNCTAHYHYRNAALSHITRLIFDRYGFYISNRKAKRYLQTFHGVPVKSDTLFGLFMNELLQETLESFTCYIPVVESRRGTDVVVVYDTALKGRAIVPGVAQTSIAVDWGIILECLGLDAQGVHGNTGIGDSTETNVLLSDRQQTRCRRQLRKIRQLARR